MFSKRGIKSVWFFFFGPNAAWGEPEAKWED
jgi:hypothetical protein